MTEQLTKKLKKAKQDYYAGEPTMADAEYDALEDELRAVDPDNELLKTVGSTPGEAWPKAQHTIPMGSLDKVQDAGQFIEWASKIGDTKAPIWFVMEKLDGASIEVLYTDGQFVQAITRGDGITGEDITRNVAKMIGVPNKLPSKFTGSLRGEIVLRKSDWKRHMPDKKNPRNAAVGTMKRLDGVGSEHLSVIFYTAVGNVTFPTMEEMFQYLIRQGLNVPSYDGPVRAEMIPVTVDAWLENRDEISYDIDGMVVQLNDIVKFEKLGELNLRPRGAIAYKFPPEARPTTVRAITWQVGRTGRITPVAELEPVDIGGTTIRRASLHTARMATESGAGPGARVVITRRNDVIPYVEQVVPGSAVQIEAPRFCPTCGIVPHWDGDYLQCINPRCDAVLFSAVKVWTDRLNVLHWGDALITTLIQGGAVKRLSDIYNLDWEQIGAIVGEGVAKRAEESLAKSATSMDLANFIAALNIRHCQSTAKDLVSGGLDTVKKLLEAERVNLLRIDGVGPTKADAIFLGLQAMKEEIARLLKYVTIEAKREGKLSGKSFCFTGAMERPRKELEAMVANAGGEVKDSVGRGLTYLVIADPNSTSSKAEKARKLGTTCISEQQFLEMV